jgi:hypothetical protein
MFGTGYAPTFGEPSFAIFRDPSHCEYQSKIASVSPRKVSIRQRIVKALKQRLPGRSKDIIVLRFAPTSSINYCYDAAEN